jgi:hypothetical protein
VSRRIDTVVRVRRIQEQLASAEVARTRMELVRTETAECEARALVGDRAAAPTASPADVTSLLAWRTKLDGGMHEVDRRGEATAHAVHHADLAVVDWRQAMQRLDGIERLSDRVVAEERAEEERKAGIELDDLVVMRWERAS